MSKIESESHLRRGRHQEASWEPLGALLELFGAEKILEGTALGRPEPTEEIGFSMPGGQMGAQKGFQEGVKSGSKNDQS